ncbi:glycoside hydrolase family 3 protein [Aggregatimonas sangjinii]|uniref:beta-N-acetylhexosaminidase n=1 Tax=Aggregatimonas sangjinii TaxID=2583587 RepID=A0A5B7SRJ2_9FLAO|nr:glycoside hydrolase family 3 protein [Aggregatimonas sangjinii]QCW99620.1 glycoside hydrolase family 3 protein [Aggregatimonas sangjinii]
MKKIPAYEIAKNSLPLSEKVGQFFMPAAFINDTEEDIQKLEKLIQKHDIGSLCFFHSKASAATNYEGKKEVVYNKNSLETLRKLIERYQSAAKYPLLIAIDAEWGLAMRIENTPQYPYAITLGALQGNDQLIYEVGKQIAKDCKAAGIHWNLAPCIDINNNPNNPVIGYRSFGENKMNVVEKALAFVKGTQSEGVLTSIKHFPGHGDTATDSHLALPLIDKSKEELVANELYPFQKLIEEGVDSVMVGHLSVPALARGKMDSSSISKEIIQGVLRDEMGFNGVVISDALNMHAVSKNHPGKGDLEWLAFDAGNDVLCFAENIPEGIETILKNASTDQIDESFERFWRLKERALQTLTTNSNLAMGKADTRPKPNLAHQLNRKIAGRSLTLLTGDPLAISKFFSLNFTGVKNSYTIENQFFNLIQEYKKFTSKAIGETLDKNEENVLLALFPPQVKPANNFGIPQKEIDLINELLQTRKVVLYLFGNPYVLNHLSIEKAIAVVVVYQNFTEFQEVAANHFRGKIKASGKLAVSIVQTT